MANRKNTFLLKRSNVAGKKPASGDLLLGELAINTADAILYASGTTSGSILPIGWDRVSSTGDTMTGALFTPYLSATTISASTYLNLPSSTFTGGTVSGATNFTSGLTANTISATTYYGDGSNLTGISTQDTYVTGGTYTNGTTTFTNNTGGTFSVSGFNTGSTLPTNNIFIGDATNTPVARTVSGDIAINVSGVTTIQPNVVTYSKIQTVSQESVLGSTSVSGGTVEEIPMIDGYISTGATAYSLLDDTLNWDINGVYTGTTITGTYQGQSHYNANYWFTAVDDNLWIRLIRG